jgi:hypothetical protein
MNKLGMVLFGVTLLGTGTAIAYTLAKRKEERTTDRASIPTLLNAACQSAARNDLNGFYVSVQGAGTLLDGNKQPALTEETGGPVLYRNYQAALINPTSFQICEGDGPTLLGMANELASLGYDYESGQMLRMALAEAS